MRQTRLEKLRQCLRLKRYPVNQKIGLDDSRRWWCGVPAGHWLHPELNQARFAQRVSLFMDESRPFCLLDPIFFFVSLFLFRFRCFSSVWDASDRFFTRRFVMARQGGLVSDPDEVGC